MSSVVKIVAGTLTVGAASVGGYCLYAKHVAKKLVIRPSVSNLKIEDGILKCTVSATMYNPCMWGFTFSDPMVTIYYSDSVIFIKSASQKVYKIPGSGTLKMDDVKVEISLKDAAKKALGLGSIGTFLKKIGTAITKEVKKDLALVAPTILAAVKDKKLLQFTLKIDTRLVVVHNALEFETPSIEQTFGIK